MNNLKAHVLPHLRGKCASRVHNVFPKLPFFFTRNHMLVHRTRGNRLNNNSGRTLPKNMRFRKL